MSCWLKSSFYPSHILNIKRYRGSLSIPIINRASIYYFPGSNFYPRHILNKFHYLCNWCILLSYITNIYYFIRSSFCLSHRYCRFHYFRNRYILRYCEVRECCLYSGNSLWINHRPNKYYYQSSQGILILCIINMFQFMLWNNFSTHRISSRFNY